MEIFKFQTVKKFDIKKVTKSLETKSVLQSWPDDMINFQILVPGIDNIYVSFSYQFKHSNWDKLNQTHFQP